MSSIMAAEGMRGRQAACGINRTLSPRLGVRRAERRQEAASIFYESASSSEPWIPASRSGGVKMDGMAMDAFPALGNDV